MPCLFRRSRRATISLRPDLARAVQKISERERRPARDVVIQLLKFALAYHATHTPVLPSIRWAASSPANREILRRWNSLSPREQEAAALACLKCTTHQIAVCMRTGDETARTHLRRALHKFGLRTRKELARTLAGWDFSSYRKV